MMKSASSLAGMDRKEKAAEFFAVISKEINCET